MEFFDGGGGRRGRIRLGGQSATELRPERKLEQVREQREHRQATRRTVDAAGTIQKWWRGSKERERIRSARIADWDAWTAFVVGLRPDLQTEAILAPNDAVALPAAIVAGGLRCLAAALGGKGGQIAIRGDCLPRVHLAARVVASLREEDTAELGKMLPQCVSHRWAALFCCFLGRAHELPSTISQSNATLATLKSLKTVKGWRKAIPEGASGANAATGPFANHFLIPSAISRPFVGLFGHGVEMLRHELATFLDRFPKSSLRGDLAAAVGDWLRNHLLSSASEKELAGDMIRMVLDELRSIEKDPRSLSHSVDSLTPWLFGSLDPSGEAKSQESSGFLAFAVLGTAAVRRAIMQIASVPLLGMRLKGDQKEVFAEFVSLSSHLAIVLRSPFDRFPQFGSANVAIWMRRSLARCLAANLCAVVPNLYKQESISSSSNSSNSSNSSPLISHSLYAHLGFLELLFDTLRLSPEWWSSNSFVPGKEGKEKESQSGEIQNKSLTSRSSLLQATGTGASVTREANALDMMESPSFRSSSASERGRRRVHPVSRETEENEENVSSPFLNSFPNDQVSLNHCFWPLQTNLPSHENSSSSAKNSVSNGMSKMILQRISFALSSLRPSEPDFQLMPSLVPFVQKQSSQLIPSVVTLLTHCASLVVPASTVKNLAIPFGPGLSLEQIRLFYIMISLPPICRLVRLVMFEAVRLPDPSWSVLEDAIMHASPFLSMLVQVLSHSQVCRDLIQQRIPGWISSGGRRALAGGVFDVLRVVCWTVRRALVGVGEDDFLRQIGKTNDASETILASGGWRDAFPFSTASALSSFCALLRGFAVAYYLTLPDWKGRGEKGEWWALESTSGGLVVPRWFGADVVALLRELHERHARTSFAEERVWLVKGIDLLKWLDRDPNEAMNEEENEHAMSLDEESVSEEESDQEEDSNEEDEEAEEGEEEEEEGNEEDDEMAHEREMEEAMMMSLSNSHSPSSQPSSFESQPSSRLVDSNGNVSVQLPSVASLPPLFRSRPSHLFSPFGISFRPPRPRNSRRPIHRDRNQHVVATLLLEQIPFCLSFRQRTLLFRRHVKADFLMLDRSSPMSPVIPLRVRRSMMFEDAYAAISPLLTGSGNPLVSRGGWDLGWRQGAGELRESLKAAFRVQILRESGEEEPGIDGGGVTKEFLTSMLRDAFSGHYALFLATESGGLYPNPASRFVSEDHLLQLEFLGAMLGKALHEGILVELPFAKFFLARLLGKGVSFDDLKSLDAEVYKNLLFLRKYQGIVEDLGLFFTLTSNIFGENETVELIPGGTNVPVTAENRLRYCYLVAQHRLSSEIRPQCEAFLRGLSRLIHLPWLEMFSQSELQLLISGSNAAIDVADWRSHTVYGGGFSPEHPTVKMFWEVVSEMAPAEKQLLLKFVTSCSQPPLLGFAHLTPRFAIMLKRTEDSELDATQSYLPSSSTCVNLLKLVPYESKEVLRSKLLYAISSHSGFEMS